MHGPSSAHSAVASAPRLPRSGRYESMQFFNLPASDRYGCALSLAKLRSRLPKLLRMPETHVVSTRSARCAEAARSKRIAIDGFASTASASASASASHCSSHFVSTPDRCARRAESATLRLVFAAADSGQEISPTRSAPYVELCDIPGPLRCECTDSITNNCCDASHTNSGCGTKRLYSLRMKVRRE